MENQDALYLPEKIAKMSRMEFVVYIGMIIITMTTCIMFYNGIFL
jgi:cell division protein FtsL